ncbi:MAG: hypothetical protein F6K19_14760 [Cyanothece sp. SIO1E1]|nr:hypothetical protein [Cyanothece sp. SIO1E1]
MTTNRESFYVTVSRAKHYLTLYTADKSALVELARRSKAKENASDYIPLFQAVPSNVQTSQSQTQVLPTISEHRDVAQGSGDRLGQPVAQQLPADIWPNHDLESARREADSAPIPSAVDRLNQALGEANERGQSEQRPDSKQFPQGPGELAEISGRQSSVQHQLSEPNNAKLTPKERYRQMWQHYSQGVTASNPVKLDYLVGRRAFEDGQTPKDIALMLAAGSSYVRWINQEQGPERSRVYVNQTVRSLSQMKNPLSEQRQRQWGMEL